MTDQNAIRQFIVQSVQREDIRADLLQRDPRRFITYFREKFPESQDHYALRVIIENGFAGQLLGISANSPSIQTIRHCLINDYSFSDEAVTRFLGYFQQPGQSAPTNNPPAPPQPDTIPTRASASMPPAETIQGTRQKIPVPTTVSQHPLTREPSQIWQVSAGEETFLLSITRNYFNFKGRTRRKAYWTFVLMNFVLQIIPAAILIAIFYAGINESSIIFKIMTIIYTLVLIFMLIPGIALLTRRLHDVGYSGWMQLISLTIIGIIPLFILTCLPGHPQKNKWGPSPKGNFAKS